MFTTNTDWCIHDLIFIIQFGGALVNDIYMVVAKEDSIKNEPIIVVYREEIEPDDLGDIIENWKLRVDENDIGRLLYRIHIHKEIKMLYVNQLKEKLIEEDALRIGFAVTPLDPAYPDRMFLDYYFQFRLPSKYFDRNRFFDPEHEHYEPLANMNVIEIKQSSENDILVNGELVNREEVSKKLKELVLDDLNYLFKIYLNDSVSFGSYFRMLNSTKAAIYELRDEMAMEMYGLNYSEIDDYETSEIRKRYHWYVFEMTHKMQEMEKMYQGQ